MFRSKFYERFPRSIAKVVSWRILVTITNFVGGWLASGSWVVGLGVDGTLKRVFESRAIADKLFSNARSWFPDQTVELKSMTEDATGGSSCSSSIGAVVTELGGGMSKRQLNTKLSKYTNIARKPKQVRVKGGY